MTVSASADDSVEGHQHQPGLLVGVFPGQSPAVAAEAARLAAALGRPLVCAYVNPARYPVSELVDGSVLSAPVDPDFMDDAGASFPAQLAATLEEQLAASHVQWRPLLLAGDPAQALARCAEILNASMIVVGTNTSKHVPLHKILSRSVAARLSRTQQRPVLVVPVHHGLPEQEGR